MTNTYQCQCGEWSGEPCQWTGPAADMVVVRWMPDYLRGSHHAAGNAGEHTANGSSRLAVERTCAERMIESDGDEWAMIVSEDAADVERLAK